MNKQLTNPANTKVPTLVIALLIVGLLAVCFYMVSSMFVDLTMNH